MHPAMFAFGGVYTSTQRFFADKNWQAIFEEDTLSYTFTATGNLEVRDSIWDWEVALVNDEYNYINGGKEVLNDSLAAWTCGGAANSAYAEYCVDGPLVMVYTTLIPSTVHMKPLFLITFGKMYLLKVSHLQNLFNLILVENYLHFQLDQ